MPAKKRTPAKKRKTAAASASESKGSPPPPAGAAAAAKKKKKKNEDEEVVSRTETETAATPAAEAGARRIAEAEYGKLIAQAYEECCVEEQQLTTPQVQRQQQQDGTSTSSSASATENRQLALARYEREGLVATTLWPFLLLGQQQQQQAKQDDTNGNDNHAKQLHYQAGRLLVVLVSYANGTAGKKVRQALECMVPDDTNDAGDSDDNAASIDTVTAAWKDLLETLYGPSAYFPNNVSASSPIGADTNGAPPPSSSSPLEWEYLASATHFLTMVCQVAQQQQQFPLRDLVGGPAASDAAVLGYIPHRQRELLLRQNEGWSEAYNEAVAAAAAAAPGAASADAAPPCCFVVRMVRHMLHLVQGDALKLGKIRYGNGPPPSEEEADMEEFREEYREDNFDHEVEDEDDLDASDDEKKQPQSQQQLDVEFRDPDPADREERAVQHRTLATAQYAFLHRGLELLHDLVTVLATRTYLSPYLRAVHFCLLQKRALGRPTTTAVRGRDNNSVDNDSLWLAQQLVARLEAALRVSTDAGRQKVLNRVQQVALLHGRATVLQKLCHRYYPDVLGDLIYAGVGLLCREVDDNGDYYYESNSAASRPSSSPSFLETSMGALDDAQLLDLVQAKMRLLGGPKDDVTTYNGGGGPETYSRAFVIEVLQDFLTYAVDPTRRQHSLPLYPTERLLWDASRIPPSLPSLVNTTVLASPKLQTQFLSSHDYLSRNFALTQASTAYDVRSDLVHVVTKVRPIVAAPSQQDLDDDYNNANKSSAALSSTSSLQTAFTGWARMALELNEPLKMVRVEKPRFVGLHPSRVLADFTVDLGPCGAAIRNEWDTLGEYDNLFLVAVDATRMTNAPAPLLSEYHRTHGNHLRGDTDRKDRRVPDEDDHTFPERYGVVLVRGCQILHVRDEKGNILGGGNIGSDSAGTTADGQTTTTALTGTKRIFRVEMDPAQYDMDAKSSPGGTAMELYRSFNLVVRREGRENNFKAVLETIQGLMTGTGVGIGRVIPPWLEPLLLGQGDPAAASYRSETMRLYAKQTVGVANPEDPLDFGDTFVNEKHLRSSFPGVVVDGRGAAEAASDYHDQVRQNYRVRSLEKDGKTVVEGTSYPFPTNVPGNPVPFTPVQVEAIRSGLSPGLTVVVGPPGTGKTDVAVQIIACLFHSFPTQRTIVVTHSNAALNDIFQKVMARGDVDERYLVRLGAGERDLQTESTHDFTKAGRVAFSLERRGKLLEEVQLLSESLGLSGKAERGADGSPSYTCETALYFQEHHVQKLIRSFERRVKQEEAADETDVSSFFPFAGYFKLGGGQPLTVTQARNYCGKLRAIFDELTEYRPFELLRSQRQRGNYLIQKQAKIVAMTCTHAALARSHLIKLGFEYDNVVVEEAGQMTDIETFIPLLLQQGEADTSSSSSSSGSSSRLKRVCLMGDHNQLPPVVKNMSLAHYSNLDQSLFSRLIGFGVPHVQLDKQGRARPEIANLYSWRYANLGNLDHVSEAGSYRLANPGFVHTFQAIDVDKFQGKGEATPTAFFFQNTGEAEYAVALFQYMVLIGYSPRKISILTTYNGQKALITDILAQRCGAGTPLAGVRPRTVSTVDQYQGQQNDYIILSLVRTESVGHLRDVRRLVVAVSRARLGLYVLCRQGLFGANHDLKKTFDQFAGRPNKLRLVLGETVPTERLCGDGDSNIPKDKVFEVDDVSHLGSLVHQMQEDWLRSQSAR